LLAVVSDHVRPDDAAFTIVGIATGDASTATYGADGNHPITSIDYADAPPGANWSRLTGPDRYADAFTAASVYQHGPRLQHGRNLDAGTDAKANAMAAAALRRDVINQPFGALTVPFHCGQQLYDVITINEAHVGLTARTARVIAIGLDYKRGPAAPRFDSTLALGGL